MKKIRVGMDISQIAHGGGVAVYTQTLAERLSTADDLDMVFFYSSLRKSYRGNLKNIKKYKLPPTLFEILFNKIRTTPIESFIGPIDIFHSSDWVQPPTKAKKITTYHDVVPLKFPQWSTPKIVNVHRRRLQIVEKEIDAVIAVSKTTKQDLLEVSNIPGEKIFVIYEGVSSNFKRLPDEEVKEFKKKYNLPEKFVLGIGGIGVRRNLKRIKEAAQGYNLIITGENLPLIPDSEMPLLYNSAQVLLYPSLYEGFGLPILESMACGTPVITSNTGAMAEVAGKNGEAAFLVDPTSIKEIKESLKALMDDKINNKMGDNGILHASRFSWDNCVQQTINIYKTLI